MLDEGPAAGISEYEYAEEGLNLYLRHAEKYAVELKHLLYIIDVHSWAEDAEIDFKDKILQQCAYIIRRSDWQDKIMSAIHKRDKSELFYAHNAAVRLDIDVSSELFSMVKENPIEHYNYTLKLFDNPVMASELIKIYENILPLEEMAEGMGDYLFHVKLNKEYSCLDNLLSTLGLYPKQGVKLIMAGLNSPVTRNRNMACRALSGWMKTLALPLNDISTDIYAELERIAKIEVKEDTKKTMENILAGIFDNK
jgi:hypothetical protein